MQIIHAKQALIGDGWKSNIQVTVAVDGRIDAVGDQTDQPTHSLSVLLPAPLKSAQPFISESHGGPHRGEGAGSA